MTSAKLSIPGVALTRLKIKLKSEFGDLSLKLLRAHISGARLHWPHRFDMLNLDVLLFKNLAALRNLTNRFGN